MTTTRWGIGAALALTACSRAHDAPQPRAVAELAVDAGTDAGLAGIARAGDGGLAKAPSSSPFHLVLRGPFWWQACPIQSASYAGCAPPLVERLPGGGLVFAVELARARAKGPEEPLEVELLSKGLEREVLSRTVITQSPAAFRWVWSEDALDVISDERDYMRSGPQMSVLRSGPKGFATSARDTSFFSAVRRDGSVLALQRVVREIPDSSIYPKGSEYYANQSEVLPARVAVLAGRAAAPVVPAGLCPLTMASAPDGTLAVVVEGCAAKKAPTPQVRIGVLRYAPKATTAKVEWIAERKEAETSGGLPDPAAAVASASEVWVGVGDTLHRWNGTAWSTSTPARDAVLTSVSRAPNGDLWVVAGERLLHRAGEAASWSPVELPAAPDDALDPEPWSVPTFARSAFVRVPALFGNEVVRDAGELTMIATKVDAAGDDVLVLARAQSEAFVLSTKPRRGVARVPSVSGQRAKLAASIARDPAGPGKRALCSDSFLVFPEGTPKEGVRSALARFRVDAGPPAAPAPNGEVDPDAAYLDESPRLAEGIVEGKTSLVVWGSRGVAPDVVKGLASFTPKHLCGPPVVARDL